MKKTLLKFTARVLMLSFVYQLAFPLSTYALTTGPSTPEVQSFEPVGTTEMVDMFSGDFNYNLPLMDVEGFPVNIAYHSGINIEQEASWVGLGWNINPGEINRSVRGLPDDFNGETIEKVINIQDEVNYRFGTGLNIGLELFGFDPSRYGLNLSVGLGSYVAWNNYKGLSAGADIGVDVSTPIASAGVDVGLGSQSGADIDVNANLHLPQSVTRDAGVGLNVYGGTGFNSRSGLKDISFGVSGSLTSKDGQKLNLNWGSSIPIGMQNYVPVITNASTQKSFEFQARLGGEVWGTFPSVKMNIMKSTLSYEPDGSRPGYGFLYAENATDDAIMDFSRDKDGYYNNTLRNLPLSSMTYDVYSISGQGTGGMFRPFRNDIGTIHDPEVHPSPSTSDVLRIEAGIGTLFEIGTDFTYYENETRSGAWKKMPFKGNESNSLYEKAYFKQAGELTYNNQENSSGLFNKQAAYVLDNTATLVGGALPSKDGNNYIFTGSKNDRTTRANMLSFITGADADLPDVPQYKNIVHFVDSSSQPYCIPGSRADARYGTNPGQAKKHHITEFTQTLPDGRRYVYGIPAMNNVTKEVTFGVNPSQADLSTGLVGILSGDDSRSNNEGKEHFYSHTGTPAYAYSYLLTSVLANDYVDVLGDGPTDDDLGGFTKINYTKYDDDYRWRAPYDNSKAQYNPGFWSDPKDDKGNYITGSKQIWHIRSIETKNYVAEFYVSKRRDGKGITNALVASDSKVNSEGKYSGTKSTPSYSYKLDSIRLFNKHDRYINEDNAVPIKTVIFRYSYRLCKSIPNYDASLDASAPSGADVTTGKLTLERIYIRYRNSDKNMLSPYVFQYNSSNPPYSFATKDRWGNFKPVTGGISNYEYPYVNQEGTDIDSNAAAWSLTDIKLPSGGMIHVDYESDDYSYVQNKRSMQMFTVAGVGSSNQKESKAALYEDLNNVNEYVYFKRRISAENPSMSLRNNYLEGTDVLYYSFNMDITGTGKYEHIKGYASIDDIGVCPNDTTYAYIKLRKQRTGGKSNALLNPATIYGINIGRYYLPQIMYKGYDGDNQGAMQVLYGLKQSIRELFTIKQDPIVRFINQNKSGKNIKLAKSWVRLNIPGLTKKGGGLRVKTLTLNDSWSKQSGQPDDASYGKQYDYTVWNPAWSKYVSSGVASYEPSIGGDENPYKMPSKYTAEAGRLLPAIEFFQEEPFGEPFFPPPVIGYSKITVKSIHAATARSSQSEEVYNFYTAKDFPLEVTFTDKNAPTKVKTKTLRKKYEETRVFQGYSLRFNDMHGKMRSDSVYIIKTDGTNRKRELASAVSYNYQTDGKGQLDNNVRAVVRNRNTRKTLSIQTVRLGEEMDFTVDSRERDIKNSTRNINVNCNVLMVGIFPIPIPTAFLPDKKEEVLFHSMVSTKIMQQYGILKSVETYDHGAKTRVDNVLYDSETGRVLLTKTNNEYDSRVYNLSFPAYWAYEGMEPSYSNHGFEETNAYFVLFRNHPLIHVADLSKYTPGDELLLTYNKGGTDYRVKVWNLNALNLHHYFKGNPYVVEQFGRLTTAPRYLYKNNVPIWQGLGNIANGDTVWNVTVKVIRSGRRNNLDKDVQNTVFYKNPDKGSFSDLIGDNSDTSAYDKVLNVSTRIFTDAAKPYCSDTSINYFDSFGVYRPTIFPVNITVNSDTFQALNRYVLGHYGNFRPLAEWIYHTNRDYASGAVKNEGFFSIKNHYFWNLSGSYLNPWLSPNVINPYWTLRANINKYDVFGNSIEEQDALGKYTSAQYGYNRSLPVAVASNARQKAFCFEGFEDYYMLVPEYLRSLYSGYYYYFTPFSKLFNNVASGLKRYNQNYVRLSRVDANGDSISNACSHSGNYCFRAASGGANIDIAIRDPEKEQGATYIGFGINAKDFSFDTTRVYVASVWLRPVSGGYSDAITAASNTKMNITYSSLSVLKNFQLKTGNIDGWYKAECIVDLRMDIHGVSITLPDNVYFDDIRFVPRDATMKSFVYDPLTFKLIAQMDENNFATFYEYDKEGLLIRVKKETDKGIMTISESRRSNAKK
ncbi:MAG: hypothetical protein JST82_13865 [Bacteroidetes bacterium]|nr:hypothetical protein [Bacteroidota bacterium]